MKLRQYKRLQLILMIPLLLTGAWAVYKEIFFPTHYRHFCVVNADSTDCSSHLVRLNDLLNYSGPDIKVGFVNVIFVMHLDEEVIPLPENEGEAFVRASVSNPKNPNTRLLRLYPGRFESCAFSQLLTQNDTAWALRCRDAHDHRKDVLEYFRFADAESHSAMMRLIEKGRLLNQQKSSSFNIFHVLNLLTPLAVFYALSVAIFLLLLMYRFVISWGVRR